MNTGKHQEHGQKGKKSAWQGLPDSWKSVYTKKKLPLLIQDMHLGHEIVHGLSISFRFKTFLTDIHEQELSVKVFTFIVSDFSGTDTT